MTDALVIGAGPAGLMAAEALAAAGAKQGFHITFQFRKISAMGRSFIALP